MIKAMNSSDFSVNAADESPAEVFASFDWGSAASFELLQSSATSIRGSGGLLAGLGLLYALKDRGAYWGVFPAGHQSPSESQNVDPLPSFETPKHLPLSLKS